MGPSPITRLAVAAKAALQGAEADLRALRDTLPESADAQRLDDRLDEAVRVIRMNLGLMRSALREAQSMSGDEFRFGIADSVSVGSLIIGEIEASMRRLTIDINLFKEARGRSFLFDLNSDTGPRRRQEPGSLGVGATAGLEAARARLQETVDRSGRTLETLSDSSATVVGSGEELREQSAALTSTRSLLTKYGRREWTDKLLIFIALAFFMACALYVVQKRLM